MMDKRYGSKAWDKHFLPRLTKLQIAQLPKEDAVIVLPIGAVEQHGSHLPVFTDTLLAEGCLTQAFEVLPAEANIWVIPSLSYGKSTEHLNHPGTITLSATTMMAVLMDIAQSLRRSGFHKLVFWNCHGGNIDVLNLMGREIRIATGMAVFHLSMGVHVVADGEISAEERVNGIHGGDEETSLVMAMRRHWVQDEWLTKEYIQFPQSPTLPFAKKAIAWVIDDVSKSGIVGDATLADADKGRRLLEKTGDRLAQALLDIAAFEMTSLRADLSSPREL